MDRHDGCGLGGDGGLNLFGVDATGFFLNIHKDGLTAIPPDAMGGGDKAIRGGDNFASDP